MRKRIRVATMTLLALSTMAFRAGRRGEDLGRKLAGGGQEGHQEKVPEGRDREGHQGGRGRQDDLRGPARDQGPTGRCRTEGRRDHPGDREGDPLRRAPARVKKALAAKYPGAKIEKVEKVTKGEDGPPVYEIALKTEVVLTAKGKVVRAKEKEEDDEKPSAKAKKSKKDEDDDDDDDDDEEKDEK